jgi:hypothetical protein
MMRINLPVPDHSTLSKRGKDLKVNLPKKNNRKLNIVMDSTGLKIYGEGEWKVRQHGVSKRRTWRKLHIGANPEDGEIQAVILTENSVSDDAAVAVLLKQIEQEIDEFAADGAYNKRKVYDGRERTLTECEDPDSTAQECAHLETRQHPSRASPTRREFALHS